MPNRVFLDRRDAGTPPVEHAAQAHGPLTVRLAAGHDAGDERQRPRPGHFDAVDLPGQYPCQAPDPGMSPGNVTAVASQLRFSPPGRRRTWLPGASAPYPGITLSDESEQGERAHSRRSVRPSAWFSSTQVRSRSGRSALSSVFSRSGSDNPRLRLRASGASEVAASEAPRLQMRILVDCFIHQGPRYAPGWLAVHDQARIWANPRIRMKRFSVRRSQADVRRRRE